MDSAAVEEALLRALYEARYTPGLGDSVTLRPWAAERGLEEAAVFAAYETLCEKGVVEGRGMGAQGISIALSSFGVLTTEERGLVPHELVAHNQSVRTDILAAMAEIREEGIKIGDACPAIAAKAGVSEHDFHANIGILLDHGLAECPGVGIIRISEHGMERVVEWRQRKERLALLRSLQNSSNPQDRGRALEGLLADVIASEGWTVERGVQAKGEETDLLLSRGTEYYLLESKWHAKAVEASVYREFLGRVTARVGVRGVLVSMSGFTSGAIDAARTRLSDAVVLLFGASDIEAMITGKEGFGSLLLAKLRAIIGRREMLVDGEVRT